MALNCKWFHCTVILVLRFEDQNYLCDMLRMCEMSDGNFSLAHDEVVYRYTRKGQNNSIWIWYM